MPVVETLDKQSKTFEQRRFDARVLALASEAGRIAINSAEQDYVTDLDRRFKDEMTSTFVEALKGEVDTHYEFELVDGRLIAEDGEPIEVILQRGFRADNEKAAEDNFYEFLPGRSWAELENFRKFEAMARGEVEGNSLLEVSVYNEELDTDAISRKKLIRGAQKPHWGRSMIRLSYWDGQKAHIFTTSSDNLIAAERRMIRPEEQSTNLLRLATSQVTGYEFAAKDANGMLAEPIALDLTNESAFGLTKKIAKQVDGILATRYGGEWQQGRQAGESIKLHEYVMSQTQVWEGFKQAEEDLRASSISYEGYKHLLDQEIYKCIALLEMRLENGVTDEQIIDYGAASGGAGSIAASEGRSYDACGMVINASETNTTPGLAGQSGKESIMRLKNKLISCPECKQKVIVPEDDLEAGKLSCTNCNYCIDVCTGKVLSRPRQRSISGGFLDIFFASHDEYWQRKEFEDFKNDKRKSKTKVNA